MVLGVSSALAHKDGKDWAKQYTFQLEELPCGEGSLNIELYAALATAESEKMPMIIEHLQSDEEYKMILAYVHQRLNMKNKGYDIGVHKID